MGIPVTAQKPLIKAEIDKITYSLEDDPEALKDRLFHTFLGLSEE